MKVSLNFAQELSNVNLRSLSTNDLIKLASERLGGVEGYDDLSKHYDGIVVAKVMECQKHPNADKLNLCKIDDGGVVQNVARDDKGYVQVVCGAPNVAKDLLVAWIPPGSVVPSSYGEKDLFVLEARDLRGQISNGMLASPRELAINDDHDGILVIEESVKPGTNLKDILKLDDVIIEVENKMFTHRPDCFGQLGVARELAGIQGLAFESPDWYKQAIDSKTSETSDDLTITNKIPDLCPRYMAVTLSGLSVKPSPIWLQSYLKRLGVRPINNIVDITNYMMLLTAQPLHAFDFDKVVSNGKANIVVRQPNNNEHIGLLDGKKITPHSDAILICDQDKPIALGGVMGGNNSEVDENTRKIVLECATFDMYSIRKTSMEHGIFTDAVTRFNKGQPTEQLPAVINKAIDLYKELAGAMQDGPVVDSYPTKSTNSPVSTTVEFINKRLGSSLNSEEITKLLTNVEFSVEASGDQLKVLAPFWRTDIEIPEDIVEEVGRLYGFNNLPIELPRRSIKPVAPEPKAKLKQQLRQILARAGANEVVTYSFVHGNLLKKVGQKPEDSYAIRNALSPDLEYYRQTLTPSLLDLVHPNIKSGFNEFAIFELNKTHNKVHDLDSSDLPGELNMVSLVYSSKNQKEPAYYNARSYLDFMINTLGYTLVYSPIDKDPGYPVTAPFDYKRSALITVKEVDAFLGIIGEYKQSVIEQLKLPTATAGFEIGLDHLLEVNKAGKEKKYIKLSKYPSSEQDITLKVDQKVLFVELENALINQLSNTEYLYKLAPLSIFAKPGSDTKNISFRLKLTSYKHTLTTNEVTKVVEDISKAAQKALNAERI